MSYLDLNAPVLARSELLIRAEPPAVWRVLTDIDAWPSWHHAIARSRIAGALEPGTTFTWKSDGMSIRSTLRQVEPFTRFAWTGQALGARAVHEWRLQPEGDGTLVLSAESLEGWLVRMFPRFMQKKVESALHDWLHALKRRVEEPPR